MSRAPAPSSRSARGVAGTLDITVDREAAARHGLTSGQVLAALQGAVGGMPAGEVVEGRERYGVLVRYARDFRDDPESVRDVLVATPAGAQVALGELARIEFVQGAPFIKSENANLNSIVYIDVRGRDIGGYVQEARALLEDELELPQGYTLVWSGQFEALERAKERLTYVVPITVAIIFLLLYLQFSSLIEASLIILSLPFSLVGGVWIMWALGYNMSVATAIGFIALAGVAAQMGVIMLIYLDQAHDERRRAGTLRDRADVDAAVEFGAVERVRPKMMTVTAIIAGLLPILWGHGAGADVMKRIAAPMVGGMVSFTVLTLMVIPAAYSLWKEWEVGRAVGFSTNAPRRRR